MSGRSELRIVDGEGFDVVHVSGRVAEVLSPFLDREFVPWCRANGFVVPPEVVATISDLRELRSARRAALSAGRRSDGSGSGTTAEVDDLGCSAADGGDGGLERTLSTAEAAEVLGVSEREVRYRIEHNELDAVRDGRTWRISSTSVAAMKRNGQESS